MRALIYCRVSTVEQAEKGYSLQSQEEECRKFALNNGYEVAHAFIERGESAKTTDRTQLTQLIKYTVEHKNEVNAVIIWKYDRLARVLADQMALVKDFCKIGIRVLSVTENNEDNSTGRLMRNIIGSFAQYENDVKSERTTGGMKKALQAGRWCWRAPDGYKRVLGSDGKSVLEPSELANFIVEAFDLLEKRLYRQTEIVVKLREAGFKKSTKSRINRILKNPLYAGIIRVRKWFDEDIEATHTALITKETFFRVQEILDGKRPTIVSKIRNHPDFPLRNFARCSKCGQKLTGGWSTGRKKVKYPYYPCRGKCGLNVKKTVLEGQFYEFLKRYALKPEYQELFKRIVLDSWEKRQAEQIKAEHRVEQELKELEAKKNRIDELMIKGVFDEETYRKRSDEFKAEIMSKKIELGDARIELNDVEACVSYCTFLLGNIANIWANAPLDLRQRFQLMMFPEAVAFDGEFFRTTAISPVIKEIEAVVSKKYEMASPCGTNPHRF